MIGLSGRMTSCRKRIHIGGVTSLGLTAQVDYPGDSQLTAYLQRSKQAYMEALKTIDRHFHNVWKLDLHCNKSWNLPHRVMDRPASEPFGRLGIWLRLRSGNVGWQYLRPQEAAACLSRTWLGGTPQSLPAAFKIAIESSKDLQSHHSYMY